MNKKINLKIYNTSILKQTSKDDNNEEYMTESQIKVGCVWKLKIYVIFNIFLILEIIKITIKSVFIIFGFRKIC